MVVDVVLPAVLGPVRWKNDVWLVIAVRTGEIERRGVRKSRTGSAGGNERHSLFITSYVSTQNYLDRDDSDGAANTRKPILDVPAV